MLKTRVIPCLLLKGNGLVKTIRFREPSYVGDPINAVKIFNEKEVDELVFLDISASVEGRSPNTEMIRNISSECFMPLCYGGGIRDVDMIRKIFRLGVEKVCINSYALENPDFIRRAADLFGSQSIVVALDVRKRLWGGYRVVSHSGRKVWSQDPIAWARCMEQKGAGELLINSVDRDGTMQGYDLDLLRSIAAEVCVPVIALGGAGNVEHFVEAVQKGRASAVAAGSMFVYHGKKRGVLINYPSQLELRKALG